MAIAFAHVSIHSRAKGHSALAASSYRAGVKLFDSRIGKTHDYSNRHDVRYSTVLLPEGTSTDFEYREFLWNQAELAEKRRDAQICKDIVLALPKELNLEQQIEITKSFAQLHFVNHGLPADIAIHDHDDGNPHAHILVTTRRLEKIVSQDIKLEILIQPLPINLLLKRIIGAHNGVIFRINFL